MTEPATEEEYAARYRLAQRFAGSGFATRLHLPCPGCAAADFAVIRLVADRGATQEAGVLEVLGGGRTCPACARTFRAILGAAGLEIVQTAGPPLPAWRSEIRAVPAP